MTSPVPAQTPRLSYSTLGFKDRSLERAVDALGAAGFRYTEICALDPELELPPTGAALRTLRNRLGLRGITAATVHAPMARNVPGAPDETWRREKVQVLSAHIRFAAALGAAGIVIHPVPNPIFVPEPQRPQLPGLIAAATRRSLDELVPVAEEAGVCILLENLPYACPYPFLNMDELRPLVDPYPPAALGLVLDTGHAWTNGRDPAAEIRTAGRRLGGTHLQDVDGDDPRDDHWAPGHGDLQWNAIRTALKELQYSGCWTFEVAAARHGETPEELAGLTRRWADAWTSP